VDGDYLKGLDWKGIDRFIVESTMIKNGGYLTVQGIRYGHGLVFHYKKAISALLPYFDWNDWSDAYVERELEVTIGNLGARLGDHALALRSTDSQHVWTIPENSCSVVEVRAPRRQLLAWLVGRYHDPSYPTLGPWT